MPLPSDERTASHYSVDTERIQVLEFKPVLLRQRNDAATKGQHGRQQLFTKLLDTIPSTRRCRSATPRHTPVTDAFERLMKAAIMVGVKIGGTVFTFVDLQGAEPTQDLARSPAMELPITLAAQSGSEPRSCRLAQETSVLSARHLRQKK